MVNKKLLLISNSTMYEGEFLSFPLPYIKQFLGAKIKNLLFIPYAAVSLSYDDFEFKVQQKLTEIGCTIKSIHHFDSPKEAIDLCEGIVVGGGNTWKLTQKLYQFGLIESIRNKVLNLHCPYIGWSAGSNIASPTLMTTNDMPIVQPPSFNTLNLVPFQINPHYTEKTIIGHGGESRQVRINEFIIANKDIDVVGLREGQMLWIENNQCKVNSINIPTCKVFKYGIQPYEASDISNLL